MWELANRIKLFFSSARGHDVLLYLLFVFVSFGFWVVLTLGNSIQNHYKVKLQVVGIPKGITLISDCPDNIEVSVKNNGYAFVRYMIGDAPTLSVNFSEYSDGKGGINISNQELGELLKSVFGNESIIETFTPDQLDIRYTNLPGRKVPVKLNGDFTPDIQYVINGAVRIVPDSVVVYADAENISLIEELATNRMIRHNLKDTLSIKVPLQKLQNVKTWPDSVSVMVPVEPLVSKTQEISITAVNCPSGERLVTFPSKVKVSYLLPLSLYNKSTQIQPNVYVDYLDVKEGGSKLPLREGASSPLLHNIALETDSVEYLLE